MIRAIFLCAALLSTAFPGWAVNKCIGPDGKVAFQDAPCVGKGEKLDVRPASGAAITSAPTAQPKTPAPQAAQSAVPALNAPPVQPPASQKSQWAREADMCLAWYQPRLRDPAGAYYSEASKDGRVLSITIHGTNGYGGYVTKRGKCEIHNGKLDHDWTEIHAKREGW